MPAAPAPPEVQHIPVRTLTWIAGRRRPIRLTAVRLDCTCGQDCQTVTAMRAMLFLAALADLFARRAGMR